MNTFVMKRGTLFFLNVSIHPCNIIWAFSVFIHLFISFSIISSFKYFGISTFICVTFVYNRNAITILSYLLSSDIKNYKYWLSYKRIFHQFNHGYVSKVDYFNQRKKRLCGDNSVQCKRLKQ